MTPAKAKQTFEELYVQLEEKVALLEQGGLSLDDSLAAFEEAVRLAEKCQEMLDTAELRITRLRETIGVRRNETLMAEGPEVYSVEQELNDEEAEQP